MRKDNCTFVKEDKNMRKIRKTRSARRVSMRIVIEKCKQDRSLKPIEYLFGEYRFGSRGQFKGNLVDYVKYCRRLKIAVDL